MLPVSLALQTAMRPTVQITGDPVAVSKKWFTIVMIDPDAPAPDQPTDAQYLHWLVVNASGEPAVIAGAAACHPA